MTRSTGPNQKRAWVALTLVIAAIATSSLAAASFLLQQNGGVQAVLAGKYMPEIAAEMPQVRIITVETKAGSYNLVRRANQWNMPERGNFPVTTASMSALAKGLSELTYKDKRTSDPSQFARLGVARPSDESDGVLVTMKGGTGQIIDSVHFGQKADALFARRAGVNDVFEVGGKLPDMSNAAVWLDLKVIDITPETIASVSGQHQGEARYDIVRRPDGGFAPVGGVANVTATTSAIALSKWAPIDVMAASGLTSDPIASHVTSLKSGMTISATAYQEAGRKWVVLSADTSNPDQNDAAIKLNQRTDGWAFELSVTDFADLTFQRAAIVEGPR